MSELNKQIELLRGYNKWRRGEDWNQQMPCPKQTGEVIDAVLDAVEKLQNEQVDLKIKLWSAIGMLMAQPHHAHRTGEEMLAYIEEAAK